MNRERERERVRTRARKSERTKIWSKLEEGRDRESILHR